MRTVLLTNWNGFRLFRLIAGIVILIYAISIVDWLLILIGSSLLWMAITNSGCSPFSRSCGIDIKEAENRKNA